MEFQRVGHDWVTELNWTYISSFQCSCPPEYLPPAKLIWLLLLFIIQSLNCVWLWDPMDCSTPGFPVLHYLPEFVQTHVHWVDDATQPSRPLLPLLFLPSIFPSIRVFSNELALWIRWPKCWSFSFSTSPSNKYSRLISFRTDWFDLCSVQGTLTSLLQHHSLKASTLQHSAFFMVQLSHSVHDYCKNHNFDCTDLCQQSYVSAF